jgi:predicted flap endonuclease-1-like 5' DNA nuclease
MLLRLSTLRRLWLLLTFSLAGYLYISGNLNPTRRVLRSTIGSQSARRLEAQVRAPSVSQLVAAAEAETQDDDEAATAELPPADDLTMIEGIGPKIASALYSAGVDTFRRLAALSPEAIEQMVRDAGIRLTYRPTSWPRQATLAAEGRQDELAAYQDTLRGGREE